MAYSGLRLLLILIFCVLRRGGGGEIDTPCGRKAFLRENYTSRRKNAPHIGNPERYQKLYISTDGRLAQRSRAMQPRTPSQILLFLNRRFSHHTQINIGILHDAKRGLLELCSTSSSELDCLNDHRASWIFEWLELHNFNGPRRDRVRAVAIL